MKYNLCSLADPVFGEIQELLYFSLMELGHTCSISSNTLYDDSMNILFGGHHIVLETQNSLPKNIIIFNTEQLDLNSQYERIVNWTNNMLGLAKLFPIWDYNAKNIEFWKAHHIQAKLFEFGYQKQLNRLQSQSDSQDIDVLFYGSVNERRQIILDQLVERGLNVKILNGVFGAEKDEWVKRAKIVLNMHYFDTHIFEIIRCFYLMNNGVAIVSEVNSSTMIDPRFLNGIAGVPYEQLVDKCVELVNQPLSRKALEYQALSVLTQFPQFQLLQKIL